MSSVCAMLFAIVTTYAYTYIIIMIIIRIQLCIYVAGKIIVARGRLAVKRYEVRLYIHSGVRRMIDRSIRCDRSPDNRTTLLYSAPRCRYSCGTARIGYDRVPPRRDAAFSFDLSHLKPLQRPYLLNVPSFLSCTSSLF